MIFVIEGEGGQLQETAAKLRKEDREVGRGRKWRQNYRLLNQEVVLLEEEEKKLELVYPQVGLQLQHPHFYLVVLELHGVSSCPASAASLLASVVACHCTVSNLLPAWQILQDSTVQLCMPNSGDMQDPAQVFPCHCSNTTVLYLRLLHLLRISATWLCRRMSCDLAHACEQSNR